LHKRLPCHAVQKKRVKNGSIVAHARLKRTTKTGNFDLREYPREYEKNEKRWGKCKEKIPKR